MPLMHNSIALQACPLSIDVPRMEMMASAETNRLQMPRALECTSDSGSSAIFPIQLAEAPRRPEITALLFTAGIL
jgi:hypothetical protein